MFVILYTEMLYHLPSNTAEFSVGTKIIETNIFQIHNVYLYSSVKLAADLCNLPVNFQFLNWSYCNNKNIIFFLSILIVIFFYF